MKPMPEDDRELVQDCLRGRLGAFRELMDRYRETAMSVAMNILMNREDAEDACQESFFKAYRHLDRYDPRRSFKNWFMTLVAHDSLDRLRKRKRFRLFIDRLKFETASAGDAARPDDPAPERVLEHPLLRRLGPKERLALFLWSQEGYSGEEIASVLGCAPSTAHVHIYRARVRLKSLLEEEKHGTL